MLISRIEIIEQPSRVSDECLRCVHFNALDLEFPFGSRINDLPMQELQQDWNNSICTLVDKRATRPPHFEYDSALHEGLSMAMSADCLFNTFIKPARSTLRRTKTSNKDLGSILENAKIGSPLGSVKGRQTTPPALDNLELRNPQQLVDKVDKSEKVLDHSEKNQQIQASPVLQSKETTPSKGDGLLDTPATKTSSGMPASDARAEMESSPGSSQALRSIQATKDGIRAVTKQPSVRFLGEPQVLDTRSTTVAAVASGGISDAADALQSNGGDADGFGSMVRSII